MNQRSTRFRRLFNPTLPSPIEGEGESTLKARKIKWNIVLYTQQRHSLVFLNITRMNMSQVEKPIPIFNYQIFKLRVWVIGF